MNKALFACIRVEDKPNIPPKEVELFKPKIEQCEACRADIWISIQKREARDKIGNAMTLCHSCSIKAAQEHAAENGTVEIIDKGNYKQN